MLPQPWNQLEPSQRFSNLPRPDLGELVLVPIMQLLNLAATCTIISLLTKGIPHYDEIVSYKVYRMLVKHMLCLTLLLLKPVTDVTSDAFWSGT